MIKNVKYIYNYLWKINFWTNFFGWTLKYLKITFNGSNPHVERLLQGLVLKPGLSSTENKCFSGKMSPVTKIWKNQMSVWQVKLMSSHFFWFVYFTLDNISRVTYPFIIILRQGNRAVYCYITISIREYGWMDGWMDGYNVYFKDCLLQKLYLLKITIYF